jgi:hypothetical protein
MARIIDATDTSSSSSLSVVADAMGRVITK